jgi:hypothetical protein
MKKRHVRLLERLAGIRAYDCTGNGGKLIILIASALWRGRLLRKAECRRNEKTHCEQGYGNYACAHLAASFKTHAILPQVQLRLPVIPGWVVSQFDGKLRHCQIADDEV